jgi:hypothetical protein
MSLSPEQMQNKEIDDSDGFAADGKLAYRDRARAQRLQQQKT